MVLVGFKPYLQEQLVSFSALTLLVWYMTCKNRPRYDLCVWWDVKPCFIYQFNADDVWMDAELMNHSKKSQSSVVRVR